MSHMAGGRNFEESLREIACLGDLKKLEVLVSAGVNLNSQNPVNGWTALHWAAKRNHKDVVTFLLERGANPLTQSSEGKIPADVTGDNEIRELLSTVTGKVGTEAKTTLDNPSPKSKGDKEFCTTSAEDSEQPEKNTLPKFVPNYLCNPEFPYSESTTEFAKRIGLHESLVENDINVEGNFRPNNNQKCSHQEFSDNVQFTSSSQNNEAALVLKCRLADSEEKDFFEIELPFSCRNYDSLVKICMSEFNLDSRLFQKIRKLPNTVVRNDRDVGRLVPYQEIEVVVDKGSMINI